MVRVQFHATTLVKKRLLRKRRWTTNVSVNITISGLDSKDITPSFKLELILLKSNQMLQNQFYTAPNVKT